MCESMDEDILRPKSFVFTGTVASGTAEVGSVIPLPGESFACVIPRSHVLFFV